MSSKRQRPLPYAAALLLTQALAFPAGAAPRAPGTVNLAPLLSAHQQKPSDVTGAAVVVSQDGQKLWQQGLFGLDPAFVPGSLGISPAGQARGTSRTGQSLEFKPGLSGLASVHAFGCRGGSCAPLGTSSLATNATSVTTETGNVRATAYGDLCVGNGPSCAAFMPSWALTRLLTGPDGSVPRFPNVLLVVATATDLLLIDSVSGMEWLSFQLPTEGAGKNLGALERATFAEGGRLVLQFARAGLVLDFQEDLALLATSDGSLALGTTGLGGGTLARFTTVFEGDQLGAGPSRFLTIGPDFAITTHGVVRFTLSHRGGFRQVGTEEGAASWLQANWLPMAPAESPAVILVQEQDGGATVQKLQSAPKLQLKALAASGPAPASSGDWDLVGDALYLKHGSSWAAVPTGADANVKAPVQVIVDGLANKASSDFLTARPSSAATDAPAGSNVCEWAPVRRADLNAEAAPAESGLARAACDALVSFGVADSRGDLALVTIADGVASFQVWWANPAK